jgi:hypothetical protein
MARTQRAGSSRTLPKGCRSRSSSEFKLQLAGLFQGYGKLKLKL